MWKFNTLNFDGCKREKRVIGLNCKNASKTFHHWKEIVNIGMYSFSNLLAHRRSALWAVDSDGWPGKRVCKLSKSAGSPGQWFCESFDVKTIRFAIKVANSYKLYQSVGFSFFKSCVVNKAPIFWDQWELITDGSMLSAPRRLPCERPMHRRILGWLLSYNIAMHAITDVMNVKPQQTVPPT